MHAFVSWLLLGIFSLSRIIDAKGGGASGGGSSGSGGGGSRGSFGGSSSVGRTGSTGGSSFIFFGTNPATGASVCTVACIVIFSLVAAAVLSCCGCCIFAYWRMRRRRRQATMVQRLAVIPNPAHAVNTVTPLSNIPVDGGKNAAAEPVPPTYATASGTEQGHHYPMLNDASFDSYQAALQFLRNNPIASPPPGSALPMWSAYTFFQPDPAMASTLGIALLDGGKSLSFAKAQDASLQSQYPAPIAAGSADTFYFETTLRKKGRSVVAAIGIATKPYPPFRLPGWESISVGYHSDDGRKFISDPYGGRDYAEPFGERDVIGCGYRPSDGLVFFTKNGRPLGVAAVSIGIGSAMYPTVGADGRADFDINFGARPFCFGIYAPPQPFGQPQTACAADKPAPEYSQV